MTRRVIAGAALAGTLAVLAACSGTEVKAGVASVSLTGAVAARGAIFRVAGPHGTIAVPSGQPFRVFISGTGDTVTVAVVANQGQTLSGALVAFPVTNTKTLPTVTLLQIAAADYSLQTTGSYSLTIAP